MLNRRKDSENFPVLEGQSSAKDIVDTTKEIEFEQKKEETKEKTQTAPPKPVVVENYKQVVKAFEELMNSIEPGKQLEGLEALPILDLKLTPVIEELFPTKPKEIFRGSRNKKKRNYRKSQLEMISLTKGRQAK